MGDLTPSISSSSMIPRRWRRCADLDSLLLDQHRGKGEGCASTARTHTHSRKACNVCTTQTRAGCAFLSRRANDKTAMTRRWTRMRARARARERPSRFRALSREDPGTPGRPGSRGINRFNATDESNVNEGGRTHHRALFSRIHAAAPRVHSRFPGLPVAANSRARARRCAKTIGDGADRGEPIGGPRLLRTTDRTADPVPGFARADWLKLVTYRRLG